MLRGEIGGNEHERGHEREHEPSTILSSFVGYGDTQLGDEEDDTKVLFKVWINERMTPKLLPYANDTVDNILELLSNQQALIEEQQFNGITHESSFLNCLYQMEMERLKYVLSNYIKCRLAKIEEYWLYYLNEDNDEMSSSEKEYLQRFIQIKGHALNESILKNLPIGMRDLPVNDRLKRPHLESHVICKVLQDVGTIQVEPISMTTADLLKDDIYILQFKVVEDLVSRGLVQLI